MSKGCIWMVWGDNEKVEKALPRSVDSLRKYHPDLQIQLIKMPEDSDLRCKSRMFELSPFDETLYLDADTVVLGKLDFGFEKAKKFGIAITINISPWANRYAGLADRGDLREFDTGVIFFSKQHKEAERVFQTWQASGDINSECLFLSADGPAKMLVNDQCGFAHAVDVCEFNPFCLPVNWNLHPRWQKTLFGKLLVWHDYNDPPASINKWNQERTAKDAVNVCGQIA